MTEQPYVKPWAGYLGYFINTWKMILFTLHYETILKFKNTCKLKFIVYWTTEIYLRKQVISKL